MDIIKSSVVALVASLFCIWLLQPLAIRIGLVDRPNERKWHETAVPLIGGIAMFFGFCFALLSLHASLYPYRGMLAGSGILVLMGMVDDFRDLSSKLRLCGQLLAALLLVTWGHISLQNLGDLLFLGPITLGLWAIPFTVLVVMVNINAMNMVDGQDGLAGGIALGQAVLLLVISQQLHRLLAQQLLIILIVVLLVFLSFNMRLPWRKRACIFMGDAGSTFIAFLLAWFALDLSQYNIALIKPIAVLWVMAFPLFDFINVISHRLYHGKSILVASRDHLHHVLNVSGMNASLSTLLLCVLSITLGLIGLLFNYLAMPEGLQLALWFLSLIFYIYVVNLKRKPIKDE